MLHSRRFVKIFSRTATTSGSSLKIISVIVLAMRKKILFYFSKKSHRPLSPISSLSEILSSTSRALASSALDNPEGRYRVHEFQRQGRVFWTKTKLFFLEKYIFLFIFFIKKKNIFMQYFYNKKYFIIL